MVSEHRQEMLTQRLRKQYLQALGIQLWVPRLELPGAKQSRDNAETVEATPDCAIDPITVNTEHQRSSVSNLPPDAISLNPQQTATGSPPVPAKQSARVNLGTVFYAGQCLVVVQLGADEKQLSTAALRLLNELLYALGITVNQKPDITRLDWPPGELVAAQPPPSLDDLVRSLQLKQPVRFLLLLGEAPYRLLNACPPGFHDGCGKLVHCKGKITVATLGIQQLLDNPQLKGQVWRDLQPLCQWLMVNGE